MSAIRRLGRWLHLPLLFTGRERALVAGLASAMIIAGLPSAALGYEQLRGMLFARGTTIGGVAVEGLTPGQATARVHAHAAERLDRPLQVTAGGFEQTVTPGEIGVRSDVDQAVQDAVQRQRSGAVHERFWRYMTGAAADVDVAFSIDEQALGTYVEAVAGIVDRPAVDPHLQVVGGWVDVNMGEEGVSLDRQAAVAALTEALSSEASEVQLPVATVAPEDAPERFHRVILIRTGENRLYLYEDGEIVREYRVATGMRGHGTPSGVFHITAMRRNPTWGNPGSSWASNMPRFIGPGPNNPLGTRAMNLSARLIRIHGTPDRASIGRHASRGCVRMLREDVEELFELVDVGTPVAIVRA